MKRSSGSAAQPADSASDRSAEQPADQTADDNSKRRKCDEQAKSASDAHPGHIDLIWATSTWHRRQLMKCIEEQCLELGIEMESLFQAAAEQRQLVLHRLRAWQLVLHHLRGSAVQPVLDTTHEIAENDMKEMYYNWRWSHSTKLSTSTSGRASGSAAQPTSSPGSAAQPASSLAAFTQC